MAKPYGKNALIILFLWAMPFLFSLFLAFTALWAMGDSIHEGFRTVYLWFGVLLPGIYVIGAIYALTTHRLRLLIPAALLATQALHLLVDLWY